MRYATFFLCVFGIAAAPVVKDDKEVEWQLRSNASPAARSYFTQSVLMKPGILDAIKKQVANQVIQQKAIKAGVVKKGAPGSIGGNDKTGPKYTFGSKEEKEKSLARITEELEQSQALLAKVSKPDYFPPPRPSDAKDLKVGFVGRLSSMRIEQVVDGKNVIVSVGFVHGSGRSAETSSATIWLAGFDTTGLVDDTAYTEWFDISIINTKQYTTALGGTRTVLLAEPFDLWQWIEPVLQAKPPATQPVKQPRRQPQKT